MSHTTSSWTIVMLIYFVIAFFSPAANITVDGSNQNNNNFSNETILTAPTDAILARALANGISLSDYTKPKSTDFVVPNGNWTITQLHAKFPAVIELMSSGSSRTDTDNGFLIRKTIFIDRGAQLHIVNNKVFLESSVNKDNIPTAILTYGKMTILNSTVTSWDPLARGPDSNPYHPRPFIVAKDGGKMDILKSTITNMGFSQGGIHTLFSSLAAINYYNTSNFIIANSTIAHNLYGFYSTEATHFKISGNNIYDHIGYGLDPHTGSRDFIIDSNHIRFSGLQGIICSFQCKNVTITNNLVEYNTEGIGLHWLTNSSLIKNNIVKYNKNFGIFIKNNSANNVIENNTIIGNGYAIGLFDSSNNNNIIFNTIIGNILDQEGIRMDNSSQLNFASNNTISR